MSAHAIDQIYQRGDHYDRLFDGQCPPFYLEEAQRIGGPILELACGTGRIAIPLAQAGFAVTGIDRAPSMLAEARRKAAVAQVSLTLHEVDMRDFDLGEKFNFVFLAVNALCHLLTLEDFEGCMAAVRRHLRPDGRFVVEVFVPRLSVLLRSNDERHPLSEYDDPGGRGQVQVTECTNYNPATQINYNTTYYKFAAQDEGKQAEEEVGELTMRMYFPAELDALFKYNGFVIEHKFGGFDRRPFDAQAGMQLFVLKLN